MRPRLLLAALLVAAAAALAQGGALSAGFVSFDDPEYVTENPVVQRGLSAEGLRWAFALDGRRQYFHPLTWLSLMADRSLLGPSPLGFHAVNLALHAAAALLLLALLWRAGRPFAATLAALLFAVHPLGVEAVAWVTERKTVLSGALALLACLLHARAAERPSPARRAAVVAAFALAILAKPAVVILPALLLALDRWPLGRLRLPGDPPAMSGTATTATLKRSLTEQAPLLLLSAAGLALALRSAAPSAVPDTVAPSLALRLQQAVAVVPTYLAAAAWPSGLSVFHPYPASVPTERVALGAAVLLGATLLALWQRSRRPWLLAGWGWFLAALLPYLGLKQAGLWPGWADRFAWLALPGLAMALAFSLPEPASLRPWPRAALLAGAAAAVLSLGLAARAQAETWHDSLALFTRAAAVEPEAFQARFNLGVELSRAGRPQEALPHLEAAVRLAPLKSRGHGQLGVVLHRLGRLPEAEASYRRAAALDPDDPRPLAALGLLLERAGRVEEARAVRGEAATRVARSRK